MGYFRESEGTGRRPLRMAVRVSQHGLNYCRLYDRAFAVRGGSGGDGASAAIHVVNGRAADGVLSRYCLYGFEVLRKGVQNGVDRQYSRRVDASCG